MNAIKFNCNIWIEEFLIALDEIYIYNICYSTIENHVYIYGIYEDIEIDINVYNIGSMYLNDLITHEYQIKVFNIN